MLPIPAAPAIPCLHLSTETLVVTAGRTHDELRAAVIRLDFDYGGDRVRAGDPSPVLHTAARSLRRDAWCQRQQKGTDQRDDELWFHEGPPRSHWRVLQVR